MASAIDVQPKLPTSAFSFKAPFPASALKQRRVSLALPADSPRVVEAWSFRDDTGIDASSSSSSVSPVETKKLKKAKPDSKDDDAPDSGKEKKPRKKWTPEETQMLVDGCNRHGVGNWKTILSDPTLKFDNRSPVDLKDRFRTYFPDAYKQHYPNARTHLSSKIRSTLPDGSSLFEKTRSKRRRPFTEEEDRALKAGYEKHGTVWAAIVKDPVFAEQNRRSTDLRDRFRNAFPELYQAAGYKPRSGAKYRASGSGAKLEEEADAIEKAPATPGRGRKRSAADDAEVGLSASTSFGIGPVRSSRRRAATSQGLLRGGTKSVPQSTACSEDEDSDNADGEFKIPHVPLKVKIGARRGSRSPVKKAATMPAPLTSSIKPASPPTKPATTNVALDASGVPFLPLPDEDDEMELVTPADEDFLSASPLGTGTSPTNTSADTPMSEQGEQQDQWERRASTPTHSSPFVTSPSAMGNNMIGKSAWGAQDWFSPNPRIGADSSSASSCSFDGDDALSQSHSQSLESISPGGLSPSSPFTMHHHLQHGVMDRYDLFPSSISLSLSSLGAAGEYSASEFGVGDTHSTFSDEMFAPSSGFHGFTHHSNYAGDLIFGARTGSGWGAGHFYAPGLQLTGMSADLADAVHMQLHTPGIDEIQLASITLNDPMEEDAEQQQSQGVSKEDSSSEKPFSLDDLVDLGAGSVDGDDSELKGDGEGEVHVTPPGTPLQQGRPHSARRSSMGPFQLTQQGYGNAAHARSISVPPSEARMQMRPGMEGQSQSQPEIGRGFFAEQETQQHQHQQQQQQQVNALASNKQIFPPHMLLSSHSVPVGGVGLNLGSGGDMYDLPFLDLHYNYHHNVHSPGIMGSGSGMGMPIDASNQALDLASSINPNSYSNSQSYFLQQHNLQGQVNNGLSTNLAALGLSPAATPASTAFLKSATGGSSSLQGALRQPSPMPGLQLTGNFLNGGTIKASRHQRGQSAVCPQDLMLGAGGAEDAPMSMHRKRASWDGGLA